MASAGLAWLIGTAAPAVAKPDGCTVNGSTVACSGNQSAVVKSGTDFPDNQYNNVDVNNLTTSTTPALGVCGIEVAPGSSAVTSGSTLTFSGGAVGIATTGPSAYGIYSHAQGGNGGGGSRCDDTTGIFCSGGGMGGTTPKQTVTVNGSVTTTGGGAHGVVVTAGSG